MDMELCENCRRDVPIENYQMHVAHCLRNIQPCPLCGVAMSRKEEKEHFEEYHEQIDCEQCGQKITRMEEENHLADVCGKQSIPCHFCEILLPRERMEEHEEFCGSRTELCPKCSRCVLIKHFKTHEKSCGGDYGSSNCLLPCEFCGAMISFDRLQRHQRQCVFEREDLQDNVPFLVEGDEGLFTEIKAASWSDQGTHGGRHNVPNKASTDAVREQTIVALPCEICGELCASDRLLQHQEECGQGNDRLCTSGGKESDKSHFRFTREQRRREHRGIGTGLSFDHFASERSLSDILGNIFQQSVFGDLEDRMSRCKVTGGNLWTPIHY